jgi:hypothetical protein
MAQIGPEAVVDPPRRERGRGGLLDTFTPIRPDDPLWKVGFTFRPLGACGEASTYPPCEDATRAPSRSDVENPIFIPVEVEGAYTCSTFGFLEAEYRAHAVAILDDGTSDRLEAELFSGTVAIAAGLPTPWLTSPNVTLPYDSDAIPLPYALARLQRRLRDCLNGGRGVIHARSDVVSLWTMSGGVFQNGDGQLVDLFGNYIIAGSGYTGASPYEEVDGEIVPDSSVVDETEATSWVYATGLIDVYLGDEDVRPNTLAQATDRATNDVAFYASRQAAAAFDPCCHIGINVDLNSTCAPTDGG